MDKVTVRQGQNWKNIAINTLGTVEAVYALAKANGLSLNAVLKVGQVLKVPESLKQEFIAHIDIVETFRRRNYRAKSGTWERSAMFARDFDLNDYNLNDYL